MGILNKRQKAKEPLISKQLKDKIIKADFLFDSKDYAQCIKFYHEILDEFGNAAFKMSETYEILKKLIKVSYEIGMKDKAYMYIGLLALVDRSKKNLNDYVFTVAKIAYDAKDFEFAKGFIMASYYSTDGAYFYLPEMKELLQFVGIKDNRTFDDYSQEY